MPFQALPVRWLAAQGCRLSILALAVLLTACGGSVTRIESDVTGFNDIRQANGGKTLVAFTAHGIGVHCIGHSLALFEAMAAEMGLERSWIDDAGYPSDAAMLRAGAPNICDEKAEAAVAKLPAASGLPLTAVADPLRPVQDRYCQAAGLHACRPLIFRVDNEDRLYGYLRHWEYRPPGARATSPPVMVVYELTWSPLTLPMKLRLLDADGLQFTRYAPRPAEGAADPAAQFRADRDGINRDLKTGLINTHFSDAVLYLGRMRPHIQMAFYEALCLVIFDLEDESNRAPQARCPYRRTDGGRPPATGYKGRIADQNVVIVTHSLASRIVFDLFEQSRGALTNWAIDRLDRMLRDNLGGAYQRPNWNINRFWEQGPYAATLPVIARQYDVDVRPDMKDHPASALNDLMNGLDAVYMLANQLPLLELAMIDSPADPRIVRYSTAWLDAELNAIYAIAAPAEAAAVAARPLPANQKAELLSRTIDVVEQTKQLPELRNQLLGAEQSLAETRGKLSQLENQKQRVDRDLDRLANRRGPQAAARQRSLQSAQDSIGRDIASSQQAAADEQRRRDAAAAAIQTVRDPREAIAGALRDMRQFRAQGGTKFFAFSDPNDLLTYRLDERDLKPRLPDAAVIANVVVDNPGFRIPGVFSHPLGAHSDFAGNQPAMRLVACGSEKSRMLEAFCRVAR